MDKVTCPKCGLEDASCTPCGFNDCWYTTDNRSIEDCKPRYKMTLPPGKWNVYRAKPIDWKCLFCNGPTLQGYCPNCEPKPPRQLPYWSGYVMVWLSGFAAGLCAAGVLYYVQ